MGYSAQRDDVEACDDQVDPHRRVSRESMWMKVADPVARAISGRQVVEVVVSSYRVVSGKQATGQGMNAGVSKHAQQ